MNPYLKARLKVSNGTYFRSVDDNAAEAWAVQDALTDVMRWYKGLERDGVLNKALNAIEDMRGDKAIKYTAPVRHCQILIDEYREVQFKRFYPELRRYVLSGHIA